MGELPYRTDGRTGTWSNP